MDQNPLTQVRKLVKELSYREGDFTLSSGKKSHFYIDLKNTTLHPEGAFWVGEAAWEKLASENLEIEGVGGLTLGADPIATALSLAARSKGVTWPAFIVRKEAKGHGTSRYIEGMENLRPNAQLLVLEDVVTTGASSIKAIHRLKEAGFRPVAVLTVVDREEGGAETIAAEGVRFLSLTTVKKIAESPL